MTEAATRLEGGFPIPYVTMISSTHRLTVFAVFLATLGITGCTNDNNRTTTTAEVKAADVKRQSYIDSLPNLTADQKAQMKSHMGGAPAAAMGRGPGPVRDPAQTMGAATQAGNGPSQHSGYMPQPGNGPPRPMGTPPQPGSPPTPNGG